jgi:putative transposase
VNNKNLNKRITLMKEDLTQVQSEATFDNALEAVLRLGARQLLQQAIEAEIAEYIQEHSDARDISGRRLVTRNGHLPERSIQTGIGSLKIQQPRVRDQRQDRRFSSCILPRYARRAPSIEVVIPVLYLKGISSGDFSEALEALLGPHAQGLSSTTVVRLKKVWEDEYKEWKQRDLFGKRYAYIWADGIYTNVRLTDERPCTLVLIGALSDGTKELIAVHDGQRESKLSWKEVLSDLKRRGLVTAPELAIGDGALGFWGALEEEYPSTRHQRCWVHKTANILDKLPKCIQPSAKSLIHQMYMAPSKAEALKSFNCFLGLYDSKYPKACQCLSKDKDCLFTFYDFPATHWQHIRTTNPIESTFATVRHRTKLTKGGGSRMAVLSMVYKLIREAERSWNRLRGHKLIDKVIKGIRFKDGEEVVQTAA